MCRWELCCIGGATVQSIYHPGWWLFQSRFFLKARPCTVEKAHISNGAYKRKISPTMSPSMSRAPTVSRAFEFDGVIYSVYYGLPVNKERRPVYCSTLLSPFYNYENAAWKKPRFRSCFLFREIGNHCIVLDLTHCTAGVSDWTNVVGEKKTLGILRCTVTYLV